MTHPIQRFKSIFHAKNPDLDSKMYQKQSNIQIKFSTKYGLLTQCVYGVPKFTDRMKSNEIGPSKIALHNCSSSSYKKPLAFVKPYQLGRKEGVTGCTKGCSVS